MASTSLAPVATPTSFLYCYVATIYSVNYSTLTSHICIPLPPVTQPLTYIL